MGRTHIPLDLLIAYIKGFGLDLFVIIRIAGRGGEGGIPSDAKYQKNVSKSSGT